MAFQDAPIRQKLTTIILGTSSVVLLVTCAAFLAYDVVTFRQSTIRQLATLGDVIAANSTGVVAFDNAEDATAILSALRVDRHIVAACLSDRDGRLLGDLLRSDRFPRWLVTAAVDDLVADASVKLAGLSGGQTNLSQLAADPAPQSQYSAPHSWPSIPDHQDAPTAMISAARSSPCYSAQLSRLGSYTAARSSTHC